MPYVDRRAFLTTTLAAALAAGGPQAVTAPRGSASAVRRRIDLHHHIAPPAWLAAVRGRPLLQPANTRWTVDQSLEDMDRGSVAAAVVSVTNPGLWFGDPTATRLLARACNEYVARLVSDHPGRFGSFAAMPLPSVDDTLAEIAYAYDVLKADGVALFTSYGTAWLGNSAFRPVMEELHRRKALVTVHPTAADCCRTLSYAPGLGPGSIEYENDTTRAIAGVAFSGDAARFPGIRFIWSHAGGTAPFLAGRIETAAAQATEALPHGFIAALKTFHYDVAGAANRGALTSLLQLVGPERIVFGTDFPPGGTSAVVAASLTDVGLFTESDLRAIEYDNALRLVPRLAAALVGLG